MSVEDHDVAQIVIETVGALVVVLDREGRIQRWNAACEQATGYGRDDVLGRHFDFLLLPEERDAVHAVFARLIARDSPSRHENHWVTKRGDRRFIAWSNRARSSPNRKRASRGAASDGPSGGS